VYFLQITQAPITVTIQDPEHPEKSEILTIPKFPLSQITEWAAEIAEAYENKATDGLDDIRKREYLTMYPTIPPSIEEMKRHLRTPPGIRRVLDYCIPKAAVAGANGSSSGAKDVQYVDFLVKVNGTGRLAALAWHLADLEDKSLEKPIIRSLAQKEEVVEGNDPLK
jgi:hypothetical protein